MQQDCVPFPEENAIFRIINREKFMPTPHPFWASNEFIPVDMVTHSLQVVIGEQWSLAIRAVGIYFTCRE
jgi:hypothetical protein